MQVVPTLTHYWYCCPNVGPARTAARGPLTVTTKLASWQLAIFNYEVWNLFTFHNLKQYFGLLRVSIGIRRHGRYLCHGIDIINRNACQSIGDGGFETQGFPRPNSDAGYKGRLHGCRVHCTSSALGDIEVAALSSVVEGQSRGG